MKHLGDITKMKGFTTPAVDVITGGSPCFVKGTPILTEKGYASIEDVSVGDSVLSHDGAFHRVTDLMTRQAIAGEIKFSGTPVIHCTKEHPFWVRTMRRVWDNENRTYRRVLGDAHWASAGILTKMDFVCAPIVPETQICPDITNEEAWLMGRFLADGYVNNSQRNDRPLGQMNHKTIFCVGYSKFNSFMEHLVEYHGCAKKEKTVVKVEINNLRLMQLCMLCGKGALHKTVPPEILFGSTSVAKKFLDGYLSGDGHFYDSKEMWSATTVSKYLAYTLQLLSERVYATRASVYEVPVPETTKIEGRTVHQNTQYQVHFRKIVKKQSKYIKDGPFLWAPLTKEFTVIDTKEVTVYNLEVENTHSYNVFGLACHNCQDLSVAGKRAGLAGARSGLFMEQIRLIKEMRGATFNVYPKYMVWENVPGAFSSNGGKDFQAVLEECAHVVDETAVIPEPPKGKWPTAGCIMGDGYSIAWRTMDAQYWGVPQRRRRIALVVDFGGKSAPEILFEPESMRGDTASSAGARKGTSEDAERGAGATICYGIGGYNSEGMLSSNPKAGIYKADTSRTLDLNGGSPACNQGGIAIVQPAAFMEPVTYPGDGITSRANASNPRPGDPCHTLNTDSRNYLVQPDAFMGGQRMDVTDDVTATLRAEAHHPPLVFENHSQDSRYTGPLDVAPTVASTFGMGGNNQPFVVETPKTLKIRSGCEGGGKGALVQEDKSATLSCNNEQTVFVPKCYGICSYASNSMKSDNPHSGIYEASTSRTLDLNGGSPACNQGGIAIVQPAAFMEPVTYPGAGLTSRVNASNPRPGGPCHTLNTDSRNYLVQPAAFMGGQGVKAGQGYPCVMTATDRHAGHEHGVICLNPWDAQSCRCYSADGVWHSLTANENGGQSRDAVLFEPKSAFEENWAETDVKNALRAEASKSSPVICIDRPAVFDARGNGEIYCCEDIPHMTPQEEISPCPSARGYKSQNYINQKYIVRRLTPLECERLQGYPDGWTDLGEWTDSKGKKHKDADSPRYKALGNSIALPQWYYVLGGIAKRVPENATLGSLFDGIGGFPKVWSDLHNGNKSLCVWASEIEEFPIAVTKVRFPE